jgi:hypothetical protein
MTRMVTSTKPRTMSSADASKDVRNKASREDQVGKPGF